MGKPSLLTHPQNAYRHVQNCVRKPPMWLWRSRKVLQRSRRLPLMERRRNLFYLLSLRMSSQRWDFKANSLHANRSWGLNQEQNSGDLPHSPCSHMMGVNCSSCYKWVLCCTKSAPWVVSVFLGVGFSVMLWRNKPFGGCRNSFAGEKKVQLFTCSGCI